MTKISLALATAAIALLCTAPAAAQTVAAPGGFVPEHAVSFGAVGATAVGVDADHPLPIASGAPALPATATIASGASLTAAIDLADQRLHRIVLPTAWTAAAITFQVSPDGTSFGDLYDATGEVTLPSTSAGAGRSVVVDAAAFLGIRWLKVRSGTGAAPVAQVASRTLTLVTVAR